ncbi:unnamed protein product [Brassica oleracea]
MTNLSGSCSTSSGWTRVRTHGIPIRCSYEEGVIELISKSDPNPYHRYYQSCYAAQRKLVIENHVFEWVDEAFTDKIKHLDNQVRVLEEELKLIKATMRIERPNNGRMLEEVHQLRKRMNKMAHEIAELKELISRLPRASLIRRKNEKRHVAEIEKYSISDKIRLLDEIMEKGLSYFNIKEEKDRIEANILFAEEKLRTIKVPYIYWEKLGESFISKP